MTRGPLLVALAFACVTPPEARAQASDPGGSAALTILVAAKDSALFAAFNRCDGAALGTFFTEDLEFYHDRGGLTSTRAAFVRGFEDGCRQGQIGRRELVPGSLEVHRIPGVGALYLGIHRFFVRTPSGERPGDVAKFAMLWREQAGIWQISRVFSFGHRDQRTSGGTGTGG